MAPPPPPAIELARCRCGHFLFEHVPRPPLRCDSWPCSCEAYRPALRSWRCRPCGRVVLGPDDDRLPVRCACGGLAIPMEQSQGAPQGA